MDGTHCDGGAHEESKDEGFGEVRRAERDGACVTYQQCSGGWPRG
jgi:hypothetical protein